MFRWNDVEDQKIFGLTLKMYREPYRVLDSNTSVFRNLEFDHYAYKYMGSELFAYKIMDANFTRYMEERGDLSRIGDIMIPTVQDTTRTVL